MASPVDPMWSETVTSCAASCSSRHGFCGKGVEWNDSCDGSCFQRVKKVSGEYFLDLVSCWKIN